jgi:DNA-binding transcriptional regulator GbsR (MarR family)
MERMARDEQGLADFVEQSASALAAAGFPRMPARVLMALTAAENGSLTAGELGEQLGVSAAGISGAVRYLQTVRMVRRVAQPGSRRALYELPEHSWYAATMATNPTYDHLEALARRAVAAIDDPDSLASQRIQEMHDFFVFIQKRMPKLLEEWEAERADAIARSELDASA